MTKITVEELEERMDDVHVVDIRSEDDYADSSIDGSQNRPVRDDLLAGDLDAVHEQLNALPKDQELIIVCDAGVASHETAKLLSERGRNARSLEGGLQNWTATKE